MREYYISVYLGNIFTVRVGANDIRKGFLISVACLNAKS